MTLPYANSATKGHDAIIDRIINDPNVSPALAEMFRRNRTEAQARADKAAAAFFAVAQSASVTAIDTARLLNRAKAFEERMWKHEDLSEDEYNAKLLAHCISLCDGDEMRARLLASAVLT